MKKIILILTSLIFIAAANFANGQKDSEEVQSTETKKTEQTESENETFDAKKAATNVGDEFGKALGKLGLGGSKNSKSEENQTEEKTKAEKKSESENSENEDEKIDAEKAATNVGDEIKKALGKLGLN